MGTKEVLYRTRSMSWGCDTRLYRTFRSLCEELPRCLGAGAPRVLKQDRGNGGNGVWKVESAAPTASGNPALAPYTRLRVRHAKRGSVEEALTFGEFLTRCERSEEHTSELQSLMRSPYDVFGLQNKKPNHPY